MRYTTICFCCWTPRFIFSHNTFRLVGLLFYISEPAQTTSRTSKILNPERRAKSGCYYYCYYCWAPHLHRGKHLLIFRSTVKQNKTNFKYFQTRFEVHMLQRYFAVGPPSVFFPTTHLCYWVIFSTTLSQHKRHVGNRKF